MNVSLLEEPYNYAKLNWYSRAHALRFKRFVEHRKLTCMECGGAGWFYIDYFPELGCGPQDDCGWCEGTGYMAPHDRGMWLRLKKEEKRNGRSSH